ncbi:MAG: hypothetical protein V7723_04095 [Sneathiella sp.]|uniref:hypothetical protein n=1 Tax=Sneathiella sp. TaxID=1964365 RepID=UPI0030038800
MANTSLDKEKQAIVKNLIDTCGLQRALHAATQFGWHDIASEISEEIDRKKHDRRQTPTHH